MQSILDLAITRRQFWRVGGLTVGGYHVLPLIKPLGVRAASRVQPRGTARFCIFVMLDGGPSHVDGFDVKEGKWTPPDFDIRTITPDIRLPYSLYPRLAANVQKLLFARSVAAWDAVHGRAQYYVQAAHPLNLALKKEIPPMGAVAAYEYASRRRASDTMPPYVAMNVTQSQAGLLNSGFLPASYSPFHINTATNLSAFAPEPSERPDFERRWQLLKRFDERLRSDESLASKAYHDYNDHYESAFKMMSDNRTGGIFRISEQDRGRYGGSNTGDACILARNLVEADLGTHFIFVQQNGWDHHKDIYEQRNHYKLSRELDSALATLLEDLNSRHRADGRSLLDETLVVCMGEFGRTPGDLTGLKGRDHYQHAFTVLFAGAGVKGGRPLGKTDETGAKIVDSGWGVKRPIYMEDIATTVYSAMGIDWTKTMKTTPSGREFYYVEPFAAQAIVANREISALFG
jgi:uncharacterized protein DUF1501